MPKSNVTVEVFYYNTDKHPNPADIFTITPDHINDIAILRRHVPALIFKLAQQLFPEGLRE